MKKKTFSLFGVGAVMAMSAAAMVSLLNHDAIESKAAGTPYEVKQVVGVNGITNDASWEGVEEAAMTGVNEGKLQFASIDTRVFMKLTIRDDTHRADKERLEYTFTVGGKVQAQIGSIRGDWLQPNPRLDYGNCVQADFGYDESAQMYTFVTGFEMGTDWEVGKIFQVSVGFQDSGAEGEWGSGNANSFASDLVLAGEETPAIDVINVKGDVEGRTNLISWSNVAPHAITGANNGTIQFASIGTNFFFRLQMVDSTGVINTDKVDFKIKVGDKSQCQYGNFDNWLPANGPKDYGEAVQTEMGYDAASSTYTLVLGYGLKTDWVEGRLINFSIDYYDAGATGGWGSGPVTSFSADLKLGSNVAADHGELYYVLDENDEIPATYRVVVEGGQVYLPTPVESITTDLRVDSTNGKVVKVVYPTDVTEIALDNNAVLTTGAGKAYMGSEDKEGSAAKGAAIKLMMDVEEARKAVKASDTVQAGSICGIDQKTARTLYDRYTALEDKSLFATSVTKTYVDAGEGDVVYAAIMEQLGLIAGATVQGVFHLGNNGSNSIFMFTTIGVFAVAIIAASACLNLRKKKEN
ncbi:MAG: hypothetical protein ACI32C_04730 [Candidatus Enteromonas sp.]